MKNLRRTARLHQAGVQDSEDYWAFTPGQRVMTVEGFPGKVAEVQDGPHPGSEQYVVELDNDMGGGEYGPSELRPIEDATAAKTASLPLSQLQCPKCGTKPEAWEVDFDEDDSVHCRSCGTEYDLYNEVEQGDIYPRTFASKTATSDEARDWNDADREDMDGEDFIDPPYPEDLAQVNAGVNHVASEDYPELADILTERPPLPHSERVAALRKRAASIPSLPDWAILQQFTQYPQGGPDGISYFRGDINEQWYVDCLLYRKGGELVGVLNHYPMDMGPERKGNVLIMVHPDHRKQGIGRALWEEAKKRWGVTMAGQDLTPEGEAFMGRVGHLASLQRQGGFWDRVLAPIADNMLKAQEESGYGSYNAETGAMASYDWCRFRRNSRCFYPHTLNQAATEKTGHAIWEPVDRGYCPRDKWEDQKACPAPSEPGPKSGERNWRYETWKRWEEGGQGGPPGRWSSLHEAVSVDTSVEEAPAKRKQAPPAAESDPSKHMVQDLVQVIEERDKKQRGNPYSDSNPYKTSATSDSEFRFHITAKWRDVQAKAKRIRSGGGVRVISASPAYLVGEVKGDTKVYQATLTRVPGTEKIAFWECGCAWAAYSWGRSGRWKKYEGRLCSHALALNYEGQSRGWGGKTITEDPKAPGWAKDVQVEHTKPPIKPWRTDAALRIVAYPTATVPGGFTTYEDAAAWIVAQVSSVESKVTADVTLHGIQHNGEMVGLQHKLKTYDSLLRKLSDKIAGKGIKPSDLAAPFQHIKDALRYTIAFPEPGWGDAVQDTLWELQNLGYRITEEENTWAPGDAYSGLHYNLVVPNSSVTMEVQFHTSASVALKEKVLHKMYEEFRLPTTPLERRQYLYDEMTKHWDLIPIPEDALEYPVEKFLMRPVAVSADLAEAPATRIARDMLTDGDEPTEVIATLVSLGVADAPSLVTHAMAAQPFQVRVRGIVADVLDFNEDGTVQVAGIGPVAPQACEYPTFHPTRGLSMFGAKKTAGVVYYHASPHDLSGQTHILPPSETGLEPNWEGMAEEELGQVFLSDTLDAARGWGSEVAGQYGQAFRVYEVEPEGEPIPGAHGTYAAPRARVIREVLSYDPDTDQVHFAALRSRTAASTGFMVCIEPPREMAQAIHNDMVGLYGDDAEPVTNYHVTLAYPGDEGEVDPVALEAAVHDWADRWGPMTGRFSGYGVFHQANGDKVLYASVDIPGLEAAREDLTATLARFGIPIPDDHGYTPHMTLLYAGEANTPTPPQEMPPEAQEEFTLTEVALVQGADWKHVSLERAYREDLGVGRDIAWGFLPWGGGNGDMEWQGEDVGSTLPIQGSPEAAASVTFEPYVSALQVEAGVIEDATALLDEGFENGEVDAHAVRWYAPTEAGQRWTQSELEHLEQVRQEAAVEAELKDEPEAALPEVTADDEEPDFVPGDPRLAHLMTGAPSKPQGGDDMNIAQAAKAHLAKTALKAFTPAEQKQIIEEGSAEGVVAANLDRLEITGTHYEALEEALQAAEAEPDDDTWLL